MSFIAVGVGVGTVAAGAGASYLAAGKKPKIPGVPQIDVDAIQRAAVKGNQAVVGDATKLATSVNRANQAELDRVREGTLPGGAAAARKIIGDQLSGVEDVADVQAGIRSATAAGFSLGAGGKSQFTKFGVIGHLGRSVAQQKQQGLANFANFASFMEAPRFNPTTMFLSPEARLRAMQDQNKMNYDAAVAQAAVDAQPSAGAQAASGALGAMSNFGGMFLGNMVARGGVGGRSTSASSGGGLEWGRVPSAPNYGGNSGYNATVGSSGMTPNGGTNGWYSSQGWNTPQTFGTPVGQWG